MNSLLNLGRCLGDVSTPAFQRYHLYQLVQSLEHRNSVVFQHAKPNDSPVDESTKPSAKQTPQAPSPIAHNSGTNCLTIDVQSSRYLFTGGADSTIRLWDLEASLSDDVQASAREYNPIASLTRADRSAHSHALTSISVYPFDPSPATLISTSYDKTLLLSAVTPAALQAVHKIQLDFTPHVQAVCPHPGSAPIVAVGTTHPAIRLIDLRTGLATHSLPGHNGAIYALSFHPSPQYPHLLMSGGVDGRILLFDIRRANPAFASLDLEDAIGYSESSFASETRPFNLHLNFKAQAHTGPVTGLTAVDSGQHLVSTGHDNRIRVWDLATGKTELVHFGPRIRNSRNGNYGPLVLPSGFGKTGKEMILWPNDDGRGEIFLQSLREGTMIKIMRVRGNDRSNTKKKGAATNELTSKGRINQLALRNRGAMGPGGEGVELYSAHGDGSVCAWKPSSSADLDTEILSTDSVDDNKSDYPASDGKAIAEDQIYDVDHVKKKRKRDLIGDLVDGLTKKKITFT